MNIVHIHTLFEVSKAAGKQIFQLLFSEVADSQQWRISPSNGGTVFDRCSRSGILPTYTGPNHLKLHMGIYRSLYYEHLLLISMNFLLFSHISTSNLAKLSQGQHFPGSL